MWQRLRHMLRKELIQIFRDPRMRPVILVMPVLQLLVFSYAAVTDVTHIATLLWDEDNTVASRELAERFVASKFFEKTEVVTDPGQVTRMMDAAEVQTVLHIPRGFEGEINAGQSGMIQMILDGTDSNTAGVVLQYAGQICNLWTSELTASRTARLAGNQPKPATVEVRTRTWYNENLERQIYYVPGVIAPLVTLITLMLTAMAIVREKEIGTMEQIMVTPIRPVEFILGKTLPFALIGFLDVILVTVAGVFWFNVPLRGNILFLFLSTALFFMSTLGIGLIISTLSQTQQQAMLSTFFVFMPALLLSGFMFPVNNMPEPIQWLTVVNPLRHYLEIIRSVFLKGGGMAILGRQMVILSVMGVVMLTIASLRFRKTL